MASEQLRILIVGNGGREHALLPGEGMLTATIADNEDAQLFGGHGWRSVSTMVVLVYRGLRGVYVGSSASLPWSTLSMSLPETVARAWAPTARSPMPMYNEDAQLFGGHGWRSVSTMVVLVYRGLRGVYVGAPFHDGGAPTYTPRRPLYTNTTIVETLLQPWPPNNCAHARATVSGSDIDNVDQGRLAELPGEGMLTATNS
jgi:hypothetical protein